MPQTLISNDILDIEQKTGSLLDSLSAYAVAR
jgi:hypothetical protein